MTRHVILILSMLLASFAFAGETFSQERYPAAVLYETTANLNLRQGASTDAEVITTMRERRVVTARGCDSGWCLVEYFSFEQGRTLVGFASSQYLQDPFAEFQTGSQSSSGNSGRGYINRDGDWVPSPRHSASPPAGATAVCRNGRYSFSRNRRGTCSHHGGVARWLR